VVIADGVVNARHEAVVRLRLRGPSGAEFDASAVIDTAFNGWLALPPATTAVLQLPKRSTGNAQMGDGSSRGFDVFAAEIWWSDGWRTVSAAAIGREPLVGMRLLASHRVTIDVTPGGDVTIVPLSP
jgi:predicted aspartyl protease